MIIKHRQLRKKRLLTLLTQEQFAKHIWMSDTGYGLIEYGTQKNPTVTSMNKIVAWLSELLEDFKKSDIIM